MGYNQKAIVDLIVGNSIDVKVTSGCGAHDFIQLAYGRPIEKQKEHVYGPNNEGCMNKQNGVGSKNLNDLVDGPQMGGLVYGEEHSGPNMIQGDVPYDPSVCGSNLCSQACENSRTSFFRRGGEWCRREDPNGKQLWGLLSMI